MSNWVDMKLDVLAPSPDEINKVEAALQRPCEELLAWVAKRWNSDPTEITADVKDLVALKPTRNLGHMHPPLNRARRFVSEWKDKFGGIVWSHLYFISQAFPDSIFLAEYWDSSMSYAGKTVIRGGCEIRHIYDGNQQAQGYEWVLPDIFAPYRSEYQIDAPFGTLWGAWLLELESSVALLKERYGTPMAGTTCESALLEWTERFEGAADFMERIGTVELNDLSLDEEGK